MLGVGFAASIVLAVVLGGLTIAEIRLVHGDVSRLVTSAERSSMLVGEIGRHVTRLLSVALERDVADDADGKPAAKRLEEADGALESAIAELNGILELGGQANEPKFLPLLTELRREVQTALDASGRTPDREAAIARIGVLARLLQDELDVLDRMSNEESRAQFAAADARIARMSLFESVTDAILVLGLAFIWWRVVRTIGRQRAELARYTARIEQSNKDLDDFAGRIAHDLRDAFAPLSLISAQMRIAPQSSPPDRLVQRLDAAIRRSCALIDGLLVFSRAARPAESATASVRETVGAVLEELAPRATEVGAALDVQVSDCQVACSAALLHAVVANLAGNAVKFLKGQAERRVSIRTRARGDAVEIAVEDTGPGIPSESLEKIFEPFYRVPGATAPGTGIGLATVRRIVEAHGGAIDVESTPGRGATFRVWLPLAVPQDAGAVTDQPASSDAAPAR